nr:ATPase [Enterobacter asburiae]
DDKAERVVFERKELPQTPAEPEQPDVAKATETPHGDAGKGSRKKKSASDAS